ncbi:MAG: putative porin [Pseudoxanthomonas sp.]
MKVHFFALSLGLACCGIAPAFAQTAAPADAELLKRIAELRAQQAQIAQMQQQTEASIRALEARLGVTSPAPVPSANVASTAVAAIPAQDAKPQEPKWKVSGDLRLRAQGDYSDSDGTNRTSSQLRARIGATYALNDLVTIGGRVVTGDGDDPNSSDVQLSNWDDDLQISLDLAYAQFNFGDLKIYGGKIPNPFTRTDLVWDGDVNPQGISAVYKLPLSGGGAFRANGLFFSVDEQAAGPDSTMGGVQLGFDSPDHSGFKYDVSGGYYRYSLGSLAGADSGDWRTNRLNPDGTFASDYELVNVIAGFTWQSSKEKWPLRVMGDYVKNLGAIDDQDTGYGVDVSLGRASKPGDWRFTYGYSQTDVDAVLAAFSNDNIGIATNYNLHALTLDYTPMPKTMISAIWYHYKPNNPLYANTNQPDDWLDRFRVFFLMNF